MAERMAGRRGPILSWVRCLDEPSFGSPRAAKGGVELAYLSGDIKAHRIRAVAERLANCVRNEDPGLPPIWPRSWTSGWLAAVSTAAAHGSRPPLPGV